MTGTEQALLIILSSALAILLILSIVIAIKIIQILKHVRNITEKAESIADKAEAVSSFFENTAGPVAITRLISNIFHINNDSKSKRRKNNDE